MKTQFRNSLNLVLLAPLLLGAWMLRSFLLYDHPNLPTPFNSPYIQQAATIGLVLILFWMFLNPSRNPKVMSDGSVGSRYSPIQLSAVTLLVAVLMPAIVLYLAFDSLPPAIRAFLLSQVFNLSLAGLAVTAIVWLVTALRPQGRGTAVFRLVLAVVASALITALAAFEPHKWNFDLARLHGPTGYVWIAIAGMVVSLLLSSGAGQSAAKDTVSSLYQPL